MVAFASSSSHDIASVDAGLASSSPQVRPSKAAPVFKIGGHFKNSLGHGASEPSFLFKSKALGSLVIARGHILQSRIETQQDFKANACFREQLSPASSFQEYLNDFRDRRSESKASFSSRKAAIQIAAREASEQRRNRLYSSVHQDGVLQETHSEGQEPSDSLRSSSPNFGGSAGKRSQLPKRRGTRNSSRGIDVIDDLMSSQGRSSKALLESLQSEVTLAKDEVRNFQRNSTKDVSTSPFSAGKFPAKNNVPRDQVEMYGMVGNHSERPQPSDSLSSTALTSDTFSSAIQNALSPIVSANSTHPISTSSRNSGVLQHGAQVSALQDASETRQPSLRGQEVLWALQKAAIEKAKQKQKGRKPNEKPVKARESMLLNDASEWKNAKPIVLKPEWALQIDDLDRRIQSLKKSI